MHSYLRYLSVALLSLNALAKPTHWPSYKLSVKLSVADGILNGSTDGHIQLLFAPAGALPLDDTDVTSSPNYFYGKNAFGLHSGSSITLSGGGADETDYGVWGFPNASIEDLPPGNYAVQAFMNIYEKANRADGSSISINFPCGDGAPGIGGYGSPTTSVQNITVTGKAQTISLTFDQVTPPGEFSGHEIGGCHQGNYVDQALLKYIKIRSEVLSNWWGRDMYVGANIRLPYGYDASNTAKRYPVIYQQGHWDADAGAFDWVKGFADAWNSGKRPATNISAAGPTPELIMVVFRHENPFYDDSYAVNTANLGPYGDALNEELIPRIDAMFNTIAKPYARVQEGGSTGGWESAASLIFRPDLFGVCFSYYPDSLDFHSHQAIPLYTNVNAYLFTDGAPIPSIRTHDASGTEVVLATTAQENHWELTFGTSSRSQIGQWDIWNAVFGVQGFNNYPLEPWDKVTGEVFPGAVEYWKHMDLSHHITSNWDNELNLGEVLKHRIFIYVGTWDTYYLNLGVQQFQERVEAKGGAGWANFTYLEHQPHGGTYNRLNIWDYLDILVKWIDDHAPNGKTPLSAAVTRSSSRANKFEDIMAYGGHKAAVARQADPVLKGNVASVGRWDPGVKLDAVWLVDGRQCGKPFAVTQDKEVTYPKGEKAARLQIKVTGTKRGYRTESRSSNTANVSGSKQSNHGWGGYGGWGNRACTL